ncbi:MAG TPA: Xaa-Pro peptidase family protein [Anaeromyxobacteraceae bacterium]|nr:Xaa-Pro peptidase family protein [Anaeromyxobacteraceae bacterium]
MPDAQEHLARIARHQEALRARGFAAALVLPAVDLFYLTGTRQNAALHVPSGGAPVLLVRKSLARARSESAVADVRPFPSSKELAGVLGARGKMGVAFDAVPAATLEWWRRQLPDAELADASALLREQRTVKSPAELATMRDGGGRISRALGEVPSFLREGMREVDLAAEIESRLRRAGNEGSPRLRAFNAELFVGLAVAGDSAAAPGNFDGPVVGRGLGAAYPGGASERRVRRDEPVLLDYTAVFGGYVMDMTRIAVIGALAPDLVRAFEVALAIQGEVARGLVPGAVCEDLWVRARTIAEEAGLGPHFMGPPGDQVRFVGHGVGLELDELPVLAPGFKAPLAAGMTVAVEPKFVFPGRGAVGIENTWIVTEGGGEKVTVLPDAILRA